MSEDIENQKTGETEEIGVYGLNVSGGYILDDYIPDLNGISARRKYREMSSSDPIIGAFLNAIEMMVRAVDFNFTPADSDIDSKYADFASSQFDDMETTWDNFLTEVLTMLSFGFSIFEMVFKHNNEGLITTKDLSPRYQETIIEWSLDENGKVLGCYQDPPTSHRRFFADSANITL